MSFSLSVSVCTPQGVNVWLDSALPTLACNVSNNFTHTNEEKTSTSTRQSHLISSSPSSTSSPSARLNTSTDSNIFSTLSDMDDLLTSTVNNVQGPGPGGSLDQRLDYILAVLLETKTICERTVRKSSPSKRQNHLPGKGEHRHQTW